MQTLTPTPVSEALNPKQAFRAAERLLADLPLRTDALSLAQAARSVLLHRFRQPDAAISVWKRDGTRFESVEGMSATPPLPEEIELLRRESGIYSPGERSTALWMFGSHREWIVRIDMAGTIGRHEILELEAARLVIAQRLLEAEYSGRLEQAAEIQRSLLPDPLPQLTGFDLAGRSLPAERVGGDFYDVQSLGDEALSFAIADASGHGLSAALEARDVAVGLRMGAARHLRMAATLERLNEILCHSTLSARFVSLVYGELERDGRIQFINAGHPAPLLVTPDRTELLSPGGMVLGVSRACRYRVEMAHLPPGGTLVLLTDGVLECRSAAGEEFGVDRVAFLSRALSGRPSAWLVEAIFEALADHAGGAALADDTTVLVIRREE